MDINIKLGDKYLQDIHILLHLYTVQNVVVIPNLTYHYNILPLRLNILHMLR